MPEDEPHTIVDSDSESKVFSNQAKIEKTQTVEVIQVAAHTAKEDNTAALWESDPVNPRNWSPGKKWLMTSVVAAYNFVPPTASSMMGPALPQIALHYGITNDTLLSMTLSVFLISFAFGPLIFAPLSEVYGRTWVLHAGNLAFIAFSLGCAFSPNTNTLIGFRFLSGLAGSAPIACGGGTVSDLFPPESRASAMALYTLGPLMESRSLDLLQTIGFKWIFVTIAALAGIFGAVGIPFLRETYGPVVQQRQGRRQSSNTYTTSPNSTQSISSMIWENFSRPLILLTRSFLCFILSLYMSLIYGIYYLMFTTFSALYLNVYHFNTGTSGLAYLGLGIGFFLATLIGAYVGNVIYAKLSARNGGVGTPEMRIPALIFGSFFTPVGLFWYGWSAEARLHWIMPIIGTAIFAFGFMTAFLPIQLYLVDAFTYAASALAAASVLRSIFGFIFPLFGQQMFDALGDGGGNSLLGGLAIVLGIPFPIWIYYKGAEIRARNPLNK
ncbi:hypothetical protein D9757_013686 [Collybiopsis confluens]|uniref:Major facilitator superfamily (MFS) profile domain-containing protein n=1 Tax=Collybiopsis confluens TaxID=2823264 RepID=A0A8H5FNS7_9AGAR|nr:hypothetical protein D9757_013686 [Collybiopsis confluens]